MAEDTQPADPAKAGLASAARAFSCDFYEFSRGNRGLLLVLLTLGTLLESVGLILLVPMLTLVVQARDEPESAAMEVARGVDRLLGSETTGRIDLLLRLLACFAVLVAFRALVLWHRDILMARLRVGFVELQRKRLVDRLVGAPWAQLAGMRHARINHLLSSDILLIGACVQFMQQSFVAIFLLSMQWGLAFFFSPPLAGAIGVLLGIAGLVLVPQLAKSRAFGTEVAEANLHLANSGAQFLGGLKLAVSQNLQHRFADEFNDTLAKLMRRQIVFVREQSKAHVAFTTLSSLAGAAAILIGVWLLDVPPAVLIVFVLVLARMSGPAAQLQQGAQQFANFLPSYEQVRTLAAELEPEPATTLLTERAFDGTIRFRNVSFRHADSDKGVFDLDLVIEPGSFVGVTGASGAGKTTFADLLVGLNVPTGGEITIGDRPMTADLRQAWRSVVAYAPQDTFLFHDSIGNNLRWANPRASDADIAEVLRIVGAEALIASLPRGLETVVGEKGALLSGGERQRLALARALLRRPPLLVLDESTSAIDIAGERALLAALAALAWRPSIVLIAHRTESLAYCDHVIAFADGRINRAR